MRAEKTLVRLPALDGLRGLAALAVFVPHYLNHWEARDAYANFDPIMKTIYRVQRYGGFGVDVFFVLSGFLITSLLLADRDSASYFHDFYWKRAIRILPVYLVHLVLTVLMFPKAGGYVLLCLLFIVNFAAPLHVSAPGQAWTLSIEEQFYLLWPHAIRRLKPRAMYLMGFALVASAAGLRVLVPLIHGGANEKYTFYRTDGLALGALIAFERFVPLVEDRWVRRALRFLQSNWTLGAAFAVAILVSKYDTGSPMSRQATLTAANLLFYRAVRFIVFHRGKGLGWLGSPILVYLGSISYGLYLYQGFVIIGFERAFGHIPASREPAMLLRTVLVLLSCFAVCTISRYAMELPAQRLRRYVLRSRQVPSIEVQSNQGLPRPIKTGSK